MARRIAAVLVIGVFFVLKIEAAMVSFLVIETGLAEEERKKQHSILWENNLLDVFFEAGHIVCNAPMLRLASKPQDEIPQQARADFDEAEDGGIEYFIIAQLDYSPGSQAPNEIMLRMFRITPHKKIHEKRFTGKTYKTVNEESDDLKKIARDLIPILNAQ